MNNEPIIYYSRKSFDNYRLEQIDQANNPWLWRAEWNKGRVAIFKQPHDMEILDEADLDTQINSCGFRKADKLIGGENELRCVRRGT